MLRSRTLTSRLLSSAPACGKQPPVWREVVTKEVQGFICISLVHHANDRVLQSIKMDSLLYADVLKQVQTVIGGWVFHTSFQLPHLALAPSPYLWATITWQPFTWAAWSDLCVRVNTFRAEEGHGDGGAVSLNLFIVTLIFQLKKKKKKWTGLEKWVCFINHARLRRLSERVQIRHPSVRSEMRMSKTLTLRLHSTAL